MNNLSLHIEYLLRYHDCVILPGVGAFMKSYRKAVIEADGTMLPPTSELTFNASIQSNDGLLAHSLMRRNNSTFEEARSKVSEAVEEIRNMLKDDREYTLGRIGVLSLGNEGNIRFTPFSSSLSKIFLPIERNVDPAKVQIKETSKPEDSVSHRFDTHHNFYIAINKRFARVAAALVFVVAAASTFVVPSLRNNDYSSFQRASVMPVNWSTSSEAAHDEVTTEVDTNFVPTPAEPVVNHNSADASSHSYYLVIATFKTRTECDKFIDAQPSDTPMKLGVVTGKKVCRVYAASSDSREELLDLMRNDSFKSLYSQAWIWEA